MELRIIGNEDPFGNPFVDLDDLPDCSFFINLISGGVVGLKLGSLGLDQAIEFEKDLPV